MAKLEETIMRILLTSLISFLLTTSYAQPTAALDSLFKSIDDQKGDLKHDTSISYSWNASTGNSTNTIVAEFKINNSSKDLLRAVIYQKGKECISFYYNRGKLFGAKIGFSLEFRSWNGKNIYIKHAESNEIIVSDPGDESENNVSQSLASSGYAWLRYFNKISKSHHF